TSTDTAFTDLNTTINWESFIIECSATNDATVDSATGVIWDIDGTSNPDGAEQFIVTATLADSSTTTETSPLGNNFDLDAKPWAWSFSGTSSSITQIKFTRASGNDYKTFFPLAFNNFNPVSAIGYITPEPSSLLSFGGIFSLAVVRLRRRRAKRPPSLG
ncbi:MAG: PEP-CTERM sorting domain-containing protein, partial [Rubripirellula sp.]|nr:PEP-CTERM sorting domain-containing protein [Rubripirellula sp.]